MATGKIIQGVRWLQDEAGKLVGYRNPVTDQDEAASLVSGDTVVESSPIAVPVTSDSATSFAHGLAARPQRFGFLLRCKLANSGYSVGDTAAISGYRSTTQAVAVVADDTNVTLAWAGLLTTTLLLPPKGGGTLFTLAAPRDLDWDIVLWAGV